MYGYGADVAFVPVPVPVIVTNRVTEVVLVVEVVDVVSSLGESVALSSGMLVIVSPSSTSVLVNGLSVALGEVSVVEALSTGLSVMVSPSSVLVNRLSVALGEVSVVEVPSTGLSVVPGDASSEDPPAGVTAGLGAIEAAAVTLGDVLVYWAVDEDTIGVSWMGCVQVVDISGAAA